MSRKQKLQPLSQKFLSLVGIGLVCLLLQDSPRREAHRNPATVDATGFVRSSFQLPAHCIIQPPPMGQMRSWVYFSRRAYYPGWNIDDAFRVSDIRESPEVKFIDPSCRNILDSYVQQTTRRYFLNPQTPATFMYHGSAPRDYCGTHAQLDTCQNDVPLDETMLVEANQTVVPFELFTVANVVRNSQTNVFPVGVARQSEFFVIPTTEAQVLQSSFIKALQFGNIDQFVNGRRSQAQLLRQGVINYIRLKNTQDESSHNSIQMSDCSNYFREYLSNRVNQWFLRGTQQGVQVRALGALAADFMQQWSELLQTYWSSAEHFLERNFASDTAPSVNLNVFVSHENGFLDRPEMLNATQYFTSDIIERTAHVITYSNQPTEILSAAGYWWAARSLQVRVGCDEATNRPYRGRESLVNLQYQYQTCRRQYMSNAFTALSQAVARQQQLQLTSRYWQLATALGSRTERADMYITAFPLLLNQIRRGDTPSITELSHIVYQVLQTFEELRRQQVLTWNGLQEITNNDRVKFQLLIQRFSEFLQGAAAYGVTSQYWRPSFYRAIRKIWDWTHERLSLPVWRTQFPQDEQESNPTRFGVVLPDVLALLSTETQPRFNDIRALFNLSQTHLSRDASLTPQVCEAWLRWTYQQRQRESFRNFQLVNEGVTQQPSGCLALIPLWLTQQTEQVTAQAERLLPQCQSGHGLSCMSYFYLHQNDPNLGGQLWSHVFDIPQSLSASINLMNLFREQYTSHVRGRDGATWHQALTQLHNTIRRQALTRLLSDDPPPVNVFRACVDQRQWQQLLLRSTISGAESQVTLQPGCPQRFQLSVRRWMVRLAILRRMSALHENSQLHIVWEDNAVSAVARYGEWLRRMGRLLRGHGERGAPGVSQTYLDRFSEYMAGRPLTVNTPEVQQSWWLQTGSFMGPGAMENRLRGEIDFWRECEANPADLFCRDRTMMSDLPFL